MEMNIEKTIKNLEKNNFEVRFVEKKEEIINVLEEYLEDGATVAVGGSVTLSEARVLDYLRCGKYRFLDRYESGLSKDEINDVFIKSFGVDVYLCSSNAITEDGELYNVDGTGNRIAAIEFGPKNVIIIAGVNKIVKNLDEAIKRVKTIAAPKNCQRLSKNTYCAKSGVCVALDKGIGKGCDSPDRICRHYLVSANQEIKERIKVILVNESLGY